MKLRLAREDSVTAEVNRSDSGRCRMFNSISSIQPGSERGIFLPLILILTLILWMPGCSDKPTATITPPSPDNGTELDPDEDFFQGWPDPSIFQGTYSFNSSTYEAREVELPDFGTIFSSYSWDEWDQTKDPLLVIQALTDLFFDLLSTESSHFKAITSSDGTSSLYTYEFHEPIAREDLQTSTRFTRDDESVQLSAEWNRHLCWDPGLFEQRSAVISQIIEFEWNPNGAPQTLILDITITIVFYTNGDFRLEMEVAIDDHGGRMSSGRWLNDGSLYEIGDYTETTERSGGVDRYTIEFDDGSRGEYWCPARACSENKVNAVQDIVSKIWNDFFDGDTRLIDFALLQVLAGLDESDYEPKDAGSDYCLDVSVDPNFARLEPDGDQVDLITTVLDWYERPLHNAIVSYDNIVLGSITLPIAPTDVEGERISTYTSDETGVEHVHVITGYSFYTDTSYAELQIGDELNLLFWAGKDPDQFGGDNMGALAGAISNSADGTLFGKANLPPDLPMLTGASCGFLTEGYHLVGSQIFNANASGGGQTAIGIFTTNKQTGNGNRVTISFEGEAVATAVNDIGTGAEAASEEVNVFDHQPAVLVFEVDNPQADSLVLAFSWNTSGSLGGEPYYSQWWADTYYRVRSCGEYDGGPSSHFQLLYGYDDEVPGPGSGNREILLVEERSQIHLLFEAGVLANAIQIPGDDPPPPLESWANVSASLQIDLQSYFAPKIIAARKEGELNNLQPFSDQKQNSEIERRQLQLYDTTVTSQETGDNIKRNLRLRQKVLLRE
jgi:hypothetical protein